ncbi:MAG TPA: glycyl-radical enzyme activating protein [Planctomycetota bacterium]|nr:glycyl-radical enzyme activating protein [Planctomycetota bacterium]
MTGRIFDIKKFAIHDGPGIRTTVFFKGCPLHCLWCHNPESIGFEPELAFFPHKCIHCGRCIKNCPNAALSAGDGRVLRDTRKCKLCRKCAQECPAEAIVCYGDDMTIERVVDEVMKDKPFYDNSGGGVTLSGGEPLSHSEFALPLLGELRNRGVHRLLDTTGLAPTDVFKEMVSAVDDVYFDVKVIDEAKHRELTGVSNRKILEHLRWLVREGAKNVTLRVPLVPGLNDTPADLDAFAGLVVELRGLGTVQQVEMLPYHRIGSGKYASLGMEYRLAAVVPHTKDRLREIVQHLKFRGVEVYCSSLSG